MAPRKPAKPLDAAAPVKKKTSAKPATSSKEAESALTDARYISGRVKARFAAFKKFDAARKKKLFAEADLKAYTALIAQTSASRGAQSTKKIVGVKETASEKAARGQVIVEVKAIRDVISLAYPEDAPTRRAYAVNHRLLTSADVRDASSLIQNSFESAEFGPNGKDAGISQKQITSLIGKRRALIAIAGERSTSKGVQKGATATTKTLVRQLEKTTTHALKTAKLVFKDNAKILAEFRRPSASTPKKKGPKGAPPAGGGGSPT